MKWGIVALILALALLVVTALDGDTITEDDPRWDCHTMGNMICGPGQ